MGLELDVACVGELVRIGIRGWWYVTRTMGKTEGEMGMAKKLTTEGAD